MSRRFAACLAALAAVAGACGPAPLATVDLPSPAPSESPRDTPAPNPDETASPSPPKRPRFFVASESTGQVWVLEGQPLAVVAKIPVGKFPHNISVSPDGQWVAVANRFGNSVSVISPRELKEVARFPVARQPHDLIWSPDARTLFVGSEREGFIHRIEAGTWIPLTPLVVSVPQHTLAVSKDRPNELWFTLTNTDMPNALRVYNLETNEITQIKVSDVHDVYFTPDGSEVWSSSSGFIGKPSDRIVIYDPVSKTVKEEIHFPGRYPFHSMKQNRDGLFFVDQTDTMVLADHQGESLMVVDWRARKIVGSVKLRDPAVPCSCANGAQPFHSAYTPGRYHTTTNKDNSLRVIDANGLTVLQRIEIPTPHGIVVVPLD